jgi:SAM-dependent methyltransferase
VGTDRARLRSIARDFTPPVVLRTVRRARGGRGANGTTPARVNAQKSTGIEYGPDFYDDVFDAEERWTLPYWKMQWYASWAVLADRVIRSEDPRVLDMGCGPGHLGRLLVDRGVTTFVGFDFSPKRLEAARSLVPECRFELADAYKTDLFETVDYNIVTCCEFLEHLEGDLEVLGRIRSGTRVLGTVPSYDAKAHLRYFADEAEVMARYAPKFRDLTVDRVHNTGNGSEFLLDGNVL